VASEETLQFWASAPGQSEQTKCDNAVTAIKKAIAASAAFAKRSVRVFAQGSYCNRTNVREDSDVDICVLCSDTMFYNIPPGTAPAYFGISTPAFYPYGQFKDEVGLALTSYFNKGHIVRGNKAFNIRENTYRIAADAVPCFVYKNYYRNGGVGEGVAFAPDKGTLVVNFPEHNYANGVTKNNATRQRFKDMARIFKRLRYKMMDDNVAAAQTVPSFLLGCLAYNVPKETLQLETYTSAVRESLRHLYAGTTNAQGCAGWNEVNERKLLFQDGQAWTYAQVNAFIVAAWSYLEFA
jgi:hypothetical protein